MRDFFYRRAIIFTIIIVILGLVFLVSVLFKVENAVIPEEVKKEDPVSQISIIGKSVQDRSISAYKYGEGENHLLIIGGIHGGYEWNSVVLAYEFIDYLDANPTVIPDNVTLTIIPSANPDGVYKIIKKEGRFQASDAPETPLTIPGRFNANGVDLNRNFDCKWQPKSTWQGKAVSAGTAPFSEPESKAIKDFIDQYKPKSVVFLHSKSGAVYASQCKDGILPETLNIMKVYAEASGYKAVPEFDAYQTTGDSEAWLSSIGIPSITVELNTHESIDLQENISGLKAFLEYYK